MSVVYTRRAFVDREEILQHLQSRSHIGAANVFERLERATALLATQPLAGTLTDVPGVRVLFIGRYPYKMFYRPLNHTIEILHIRHTSRAVWPE